jgi:hypothetical protein
MPATFIACASRATAILPFFGNPTTPVRRLATTALRFPEFDRKFRDMLEIAPISRGQCHRVGDANRGNSQVMRGTTQLLLAPCPVLRLRCCDIGKDLELPKIFQRMLQELVGLLDRDLRLPGFCLANGVEPASKDFFHGQDRDRLLGNRDIRNALSVSRVATQDLRQNIRVECLHSHTSASRSLYASSQISWSVGSS